MYIYLHKHTQYTYTFYININLSINKYIHIHTHMHTSTQARLAAPHNPHIHPHPAASPARLKGRPGSPNSNKHTRPSATATAPRRPSKQEVAREIQYCRAPGCRDRDAAPPRFLLTLDNRERKKENAPTLACPDACAGNEENAVHYPRCQAIPNNTQCP